MENLNISDNSLKNYGLFDDLFHIRERLKDKKVYLYGFNTNTKKCLFFLAHIGITVCGFVLEKNDLYIHEHSSYLGKICIPLEHLITINMSDNVIVDIYGDNISILKRYCGNTLVTETLFKADDKSVYIYGKGNVGHRLLNFLNTTKITIKGWIDKNYDTGFCDGLKVFSTNELSKIDRKSAIIIALADMKEIRCVYDFLKNNGFEHITYFDYVYLEFSFSNWVFSECDKKYINVFSDLMINYILSKPEVLLFSNHIQYLKDTLNFLNVLGVHNVLGVTELDISEDCKYINNIYDYIDDADNHIFWALVGDERNLAKVADILEIKDSLLIKGNSQPYKLSKKYSLDMNLGYNDSAGISILRSHKDEGKKVCIGILGGSTSDINGYCEKSWPEILLELIQQRGYRAELLCAANIGFNSSQELMILERDLLIRNIDIVISYSGANDYINALQTKRFFHPYQVELFDYIYKKNYSVGEFGVMTNNKDYLSDKLDCDPSRRWIMNEMIMHSICETFGVAFFAFIQPWLFSNIMKTSFQSNIRGCFDIEGSKTNIEKYNNYIEDVRLHANKFEWIRDYSKKFDNEETDAFFDTYHLNCNGNYSIASSIMDDIEPFIKKIFESKETI